MRALVVIPVTALLAFSVGALLGHLAALCIPDDMFDVFHTDGEE